MSDSWAVQDTNGVEAVNGNFGSSHSAFAAADTFAEGDAPQEETGRIQEDKVNKKRLAELEDDGKALQIFVRPTKQSGSNPYTAVKGIPLSVATICSNLFFEYFNRKGNRYYTIEDSNLAPYNFVFEWIKQCGEEKGVANIPEIKDMADDKTGLKPFIEIMLVAAKLKIPTASFNKFMLKKLLPLARDYLIDLPTVSRIFDSGDVEIYDLGLQEIAATSIFSHWYDFKLDAPEYEDYMCQLSDMRENIPELDDALHKAVDNKDAWLKNKRAERREKQAAEEAGGGWGATDGDFADANATENAGSGGGDNAWINQGAAASCDDWLNQGATTTNNWDKPAAAPDPAAGWAVDNPPAGGDWADEMNDSVRPLPSITTSGDW